jgi:asparaginyl-tRNA synthetase
MLTISDERRLLTSEKVQNAVRVQSHILGIARDFLVERGFVEILPVIISPFTDPLTDHRVRGEIECYGFHYQITKSMIFHKQMALLGFPKVFCFSPNIRIEPAERRTSGRHLIEFVQLDLEVREASRDEVMSLAEDFYARLFERLPVAAAAELRFFGRELRPPQRPFRRIGFEDAVRDFGTDFELGFSQSLREPAWIVDFPIGVREFYDREYADRPNVLRDMDLVYPEGFGEALSGGEREHEAASIEKRIVRKGIDLAAYKTYLDFARTGLPASAGFGIGMERLTRFVCGLAGVREALLFAKLPGTLSL